MTVKQVFLILLKSFIGEDEMTHLVKARALAKEYHKFQKDKAGRDYFEYHVQPIVMKVWDYCEKMKKEARITAEIVTVAYLHDILEDTELNRYDLVQEGFPKHIIDAVDAMTRKEKEKYLPEYIPRVKKNEYAKIVKTFDLLTNLDMSHGFVNESLIHRYISALKILDYKLEGSDGREKE